MENGKKGVIKSINLENFMTFNKIFVKTGGHLNLIIGPNGTGKSSIICGIVLGLGGKPTIIGRGSHLKEYIKDGCQDTKIDIQLWKDENDYVTITRQFSLNGKSSWMLDQKPCGVKAIEELIADLNIQVDNLCQFLPQDRVQDFSKMNAQELLENTERSIGTSLLLQNHLKLKEYRLQHKELELFLSSKHNLLNVKTQRYNSLKEIVDTILESNAIKKNILRLKQKKAWMIYDEKRQKLSEVKKERDLKEKKVKSLSIELEPIKYEMQAVQVDIKACENSVKHYNNQVVTIMSESSTLMNEILRASDDIKECEHKRAYRIQEVQNRDQDIILALQQKNKLENDLSPLIEEFGSEETLMKKKQEVIARLVQQRNENSKLDDQIVKFRQEEMLLNRDIRAKEEERESMNIESIRLECLRRRSPDAYKSVLWLRQNKDKFSGKIHEPMLFYIDVKDASYVKYVENVIPIRDLIAFICENKEDINLLLKYLRDEEKLQVNVIHHSDPGRAVCKEPVISLERLKTFGFTCYMSSLIEAPPTIMSYLLLTYNLNNIAIGPAAVEDVVDHLPNNLTLYFTGNKMYSITRSKYTGERSMRIADVRGHGMLSVVDRSFVKEIEERLKHLMETKGQISKRIKETEEKIQRGNKEIEKLHVSGSTYHENIRTIQKINAKIIMFSKKIDDLKREQTSIEEITKICNDEIKTMIHKQFDKYNKFNLLLKERLRGTALREEAKMKLKLFKKALLNKENDLRKLEEQLADVRDKFERSNEEWIYLRDEVSRVYKTARDLTDGLDPLSPAFKDINSDFNKLPATIRMIDHAIQKAQAQIICMGQNMDSENVLEEYEAIEADMRDLNQHIVKKTSQLQSIREKIDALSTEWLNDLTEVVDQINTNFGSYFADMNCAGEVVLSRAENALDFEQYGLKIKVKFRDTDQLQELTRQYQSGGERVLTTAIYMISLQELSKVPFRCLDEINQGMDPINERRVFNLIFKKSEARGSSQYFLVTPKLLPDLQYPDTVTVHCIYNGPYMICQSEFDIEEHCSK